MTGSVLNSGSLSGSVAISGVLTGTISIIKNPVLEEVTVKSSGTAQTVVPSEGYDAISEVTVEALALQNKNVTAGSSAVTVTPDSGYDGLASVTVGALALQSKSVTPGASAVTVTPDAGFDGLSSVEVAAAPAGEGFVLEFGVSWHGVIENFMFQNQTGITGVTFKINNPDLTIGRSAFQGCRNITRLEIPVCQSIGSNAFSGVSGHDVYLGASTQYGSAVIPIGQAYDIGEPASIHVPFEMLNTYKNDSAWGAFASIMVGDYIVP